MSTSRSRSGPRPDNHVIVLFGATGDLAKRKVLPGLFHLAVAGLMPERYRIIGSAPARSAMTDEAFRAHARQAAEQFGTSKPEGAAWDAFAANLSFGSADPGHTAPLALAIAAAEKEIGGTPRRLFHLAVPPAAFEGVVAEIGAMGLAGGARVIIEKPFGTDLASAQDLNAKLHAVFDESQIFRIDHFLGKESVDNILALRFANGLFEPIWRPAPHPLRPDRRAGDPVRSRAGPRSTTPPAPTATWSSRTCSRCSGSSRWSRRRRWRPRR